MWGDLLLGGYEQARPRSFFTARDGRGTITNSPSIKLFIVQRNSVACVNEPPLRTVVVDRTISVYNKSERAGENWHWEPPEAKAALATAIILGTNVTGTADDRHFSVRQRTNGTWRIRDSFLHVPSIHPSICRRLQTPPTSTKWKSMILMLFVFDAPPQNPKKILKGRARGLEGRCQAPHPVICAAGRSPPSTTHSPTFWHRTRGGGEGGVE